MDPMSYESDGESDPMSVKYTIPYGDVDPVFVSTSCCEMNPKNERYTI